MGEKTFRETSLPKESPNKAIVTPTLNRWGTKENRGPLPTMMGSVQKRISEEGLDNNTWMILGDASPSSEDEARNHWTEKELEAIKHPSRIFVLRPEYQKQVADLIQGKTWLRRDVVEAILFNTGYASQRQKIDAIVAAATLNGRNPIDILTLDDDTIIPEEYDMVKASALPHGLDPTPNSQVLWPGEDLSEDKIEKRPNSIKPFFEHLGKDVKKIRESNPNMRATKTWHDTMHVTLEELNGHPVQFVVTHSNGEDVPNAGEAKIVAAAATKHGVPDYRTVKIADFNLKREFPNEEMPVKSYPSGEPNLFAFMECNTNVDSAALARRFDTKTALWPWWFVSSLDISQENPLQTVTSHYRADNELLPVLLKTVQQRTGEANMYLSGLESQVYHNRALSGYRPNLHEQAAASLVGNVAAMAAADKIEFDSNGHAYIRPDGRYKIPEERAQKVYTEMANLAHTCSIKAEVLRSQPVLDAEMKKKIEKYNNVYSAIKQKLADFNFQTFSLHLEEEVNRQLQFYAEVLYATPIVVGEIEQLIREGKYPVLEFVPKEDRNKIYPHKKNK